MKLSSKARPHAAKTRHRPRKRFGQHFLAPTWAAKLAGVVNVEPGDVFLEIGPGTGALTLPLAATGAPVLAVDIDRDLVRDLAGRVPSNVTVLSGDALTTDVIPMLRGLEPQRTLGDTPRRGPNTGRFRVVGNLPYNIASPLIFRLLELQERHALFHDATVMIQREVADRLLAKAGSKDYGVLTILVGLNARVTRVLNLPPGAFSPPPKVQSSVVRLEFGPPAVRLSDPALFARMVKALFGQRRKTLGNALKAFSSHSREVIAEASFDPKRRPETLQVQELARLAELVAAKDRPAVV